MKTAVVMSTYNGEKYITEQMKCIYLQTVQPDEVIISDDCSTDSTPLIVKNYIESHSLNTWHFSVNERNLGWKKNFFKLIDECDADIIFLADQDDVWNIHKIELMLPLFENKKVDLLVSDYYQRKNNIPELFDDVSKKTKFQNVNFSKKYLWGIPFPGCAYAFRKTFFEEIKPYYNDILPHDAFLYRNAILKGSCYQINQKLLIHRLHNNNAGSTSLRTLKESIGYYRLVNKLLLDYLNSNEVENKKYKLRTVQKTDKWLLTREKFYNSKKLVYFFQLVPFLKYYPHLKTLIKEIFIAYSK